ncbi:hypothetical protein SteCoe_23319 [Stentor coeruleus]|uniref:CRC domain-containing protein n=1 Tax=Stentor coeruleus TaxID=5963 RepID=A0A1R2BK53_9CILI|nr:hypothetical protein SteCoe_23319 [Stentor coeruleus]
MEDHLNFSFSENISSFKLEDFESFETYNEIPIQFDIGKDFFENDHQEKTKKKKKIKLVGCNCMKTKCLKLYCECFANKMYCKKACKCRNCNNCANYDDRDKAVVEAFERNSAAFEHSRYTCTRGCNCKFSECKKKYCSCFLNGISCTAVCTCENCKNIKIR